MSIQLTETILFFLAFIVVSFFTFYPGGFLLVKKIKINLSDSENILFSFLASIILFVVVAVVLGLLKLRFLMFPLVLTIGFTGFLKYGKEMFHPFRLIFKDRILISLIFLGIVVQGLINIPSGYNYRGDLLFWSSQGNDGLWHVALMEEIKKSLPIVNPIYAGEKLFNYHYLVDVLMGEFGRIFPFFSSLDLYFRFFPCFFSFLIGLSAFLLVKKWKGNNNYGYWAIFFSSLSGGFGYVVTFIRSRQIFGGETVFWAAQGNTIIGNPPHAMAYSLIIGCFLALLLFLETGNRRYLYLPVILGSLLGGFKVSAGLVLVVGMLSAGLYDLVVRRQKYLLICSLVVAALNYLTIKLMTRGTASFLIWEPWWFIRTTIVDSGRVGWIDLELRRQHYLWVGRLTSYLRVIELESIAFLLFFVGNLGTRIIGTVSIFKLFIGSLQKKRIKTFDILLISSMLIAFVIPLFFVQRGIAYNLIQFMQYFLLIFGFYAAWFVGDYLLRIKSMTLKVFIIFALVAVSVPTVIGNFVEFYGKGRTALSRISKGELEALLFLKENTAEDSLVLTQPFDGGYKYGFNSLPMPIYAWYSTAYVSAVSSRRTYYTNEGQVDIIGLPYQERKVLVSNFFASNDIKWKTEFLKGNRIGYLYLVKALPGAQSYLNMDGLEIVFENGEVIVLKFT